MSFFTQEPDNPNFKPQIPDPGLGDFFNANLEAGVDMLPTAAVGRQAELTFSRFDFSERFWGAPRRDKISAEEATEKYGLDGALTFDEPIPELTAKILFDRKQKELDREFLLQTGRTNIGRAALGLGTQMVSQMIDPVNVASMFIPIVSEARFAKMTAAAGGSLWKARFMKGAIEGAVGMAMVEPLVVIPHIQEQANYGLRESAMALGFGALLGGAMHVGVGRLGDVIAIKNKKRLRENTLMLMQMRRAGDHIANLSEGDQFLMLKAAMNDFFDDLPVESPSRLNQHTPPVIRTEARFDAKQARAAAMTKLGFDVDQPKKFTIDEDIPDPMPNEPWFHARYEQTPGAKFHFDSDRPAFFTREDWAAESIARDKGFYTETKGEHFVGFMGAEIADDIDLREHVEDGIKIFVSNLQMKKTIGFEDFVGELEVWRKKVGTKKAISSVLSSIPSENLDLLGIGKISTWDDLIRVILNEDMLYSSSLRTHLKSKGYDSALFAAGNMLSDEYSSIAVVFDPKQIKTPGTKGTKTDTGIEWGIASEVEKSLKKRTSDLRTAKIKNEVEAQRRKWKKEQADIEAARTKPKAEPEDPDALYRRPDSVEAIEHDRTVIDQEIVELETELLGKVPKGEGETLFHGRRGDVSDFSEDRPIFFAEDKGYSEQFLRDFGIEPEGRLLEVESRVKNSASIKDVDEAVDKIFGPGEDEGFITTTAQEFGALEGDFYERGTGQSPSVALYIPEVVDELKAKGFDSVDFEMRYDDIKEIDEFPLPDRLIAIFDKEQFKVKTKKPGVKTKRRTVFTFNEQAVFDEVAADFNNLEARENSIKAGINCIGGKL